MNLKIHLYTPDDVPDLSLESLSSWFIWASSHSGPTCTVGYPSLFSYPYQLLAL